MKRALLTLLALAMSGSVALAVVPLEVPLQGVVRDNAGNPANGEFEVTFALYPSAEATPAEAVWWNTQQIEVVDGHFVARLGEGKPLSPADFSGGQPLWLGMAIEGEDELPRRPMGSSATALHAGTAAGLDCSGCVGLEALTEAAQAGIVDQALSAVAANGYTTVAAGLYYDDAETNVEAADVQTAIEKLKELIDENAENGGGGGGNGNVNEGAGQVIAYQKNDTIDANGVFKQYVHLVNPSSAKVILYLYGEVDDQGDQAFLNPNPVFIADPTETANMNFDTHSHGGGYSPKYDEFWYPSWSGSTIYIHHVETGAQQGSFSSGYNDIMQLWGNVDGTYYTANWSNDRVRKWSDKGSNQQWERHIGSTAGGVCENGEHVYAMRHSGNTVYKIDIDNGETIDTFGLPNIPGNLHGGLVCIGNRLYYGANSHVRIYDLDSHQEIDSFSVGESIYNMAFDGTTMWISSNDSSVRGYQLVEDSIYQHIRAPKDVQIHIDGVNVTAAIGDPNGKGSPHFNGVTGVWGETGKDDWSSGALDVTNVADWTLGEHVVELKETGGLGGKLQSYIYVIYPFTESTPPDNDACADAQVLDPEAGDVVVSGTTEDIMGKILATDANQAPGCGGIGGADVVYAIELTERALINAAIVAPFTSKLYLRADDCADGEVVYCAQDEFSTNPLEPGTYYLVVDADTPGAKGDFTLAVSRTPAPLPGNDTCDEAFELVLSAAGEANIEATTLYSLDQTKGFCASALDGGPDVVYKFTAGTGQSLTASVNADFDSILYLTWQECGGDGIPLGCSDTGTLEVNGLAGGDYWLFVDGAKEKEWGEFDLNVLVQ